MNKWTLLMMRHKERIIYLIVWFIVFLTPFLSMYFRDLSPFDSNLNWEELLNIWQFYGVFFLLFAIHDLFIAPLLIYKHKHLLYFLLAILLIVACKAVLYYIRPQRKELRERHEQRIEQELQQTRDKTSRDIEFPPQRGDNLPPEREGGPHQRPPMDVFPMHIFDIFMIMSIMAANLGTKQYFKSERENKRLAQLEQQNTRQQLEYLRYQINPHFFMNTLNNIHALVDIDPEEAKHVILELSQLMRYVLYESNSALVPLAREKDFTLHYINLMKIRYTGNVKINIEMPDKVPDKLVPPLIFITFVENAFKHGVSYQHESPIQIKLKVQGDRLTFTCYNKCFKQSCKENGGVGLTNVRKRLNLIYGKNYKLDIQQTPDSYEVLLDLPLSTVKTNKI